MKDLLDAEAVKERLQRLFQSIPEVEKNDRSLLFGVVRKERQRRRHSIRSRTHSAFEGAGYCAFRIKSVAQRGAVNVEASIWIASCLLAILGLVKAVYSEQPFLWLAVWPAPVVLASTIFIFFRQGFRFQNGGAGPRPATEILDRSLSRHYLSVAGCSPDNAWSKAARRIRGDSYRFNEGGDREKPGAEEGDDVILVYYGPAKRSCRNLPAPHPAPPDQPAYMAASARAQRQQHRHVARPAPDRIRLERLSPPPFRDSWQGVRREPDGLSPAARSATFI